MRSPPAWWSHRPASGSSSPGQTPSSSAAQTPALRRGAIAWEACAFCAQRRNLRRTIRIAIVVGIVLTLINQGAVIAGGQATAVTWVRSVLNFIVPFVVSNAGLLAARRGPDHDGPRSSERDRDAADRTV